MAHSHLQELLHRFLDLLSPSASGFRRRASARRTGISAGPGAAVVERLEQRSLLSSTVMESPDPSPVEPSVGAPVTSESAAPDAPLTFVVPVGSLIETRNESGSIDAAAQVDQYQIDLDAGQTLSLVLLTDTSLQGLARVVVPSGQRAEEVVATVAGQNLVLQTVTADESGTYTVEVAGPGTTGAYELQMVTNAAVEREGVDSVANNSAAAAHDITRSFIAVGSNGALRGAVNGQGSSTGADDDWYRFQADDVQSLSVLYEQAGPEQAGPDQMASIELYDPAMNLIAAGSDAQDLQQVIHGYVNSTNWLPTDEYRIRVVAPRDHYSLLVTKNAEIDTEDNSTFEAAQDIQGITEVLGSVGSAEGAALDLLSTFAGPDRTNFIPPDPTAAAGPQQIVTAVNTDIAIYDKATGTELFLQNMNGSSGFFGSAGATSTVFDPWVIYDFDSQRFFVVAIENPSGSRANVYLAVSHDSTPTGGNDWYKYQLDFTHDAGAAGLGAGAHFPDYEKMGVNDDALFISGNYFAISSGSGVYAGITAIEKAPLLNGGPANVLYEDHFDGFSVFPLVQFDSGSTQYFAEAIGGGRIRIHSVTDVLTNPQRTTFDLTVPAYQEPVDVPQLGGGTPADSISSRVMTGVWRDGSAWFAHAIRDPAIGDGETVVRWYEVDTGGFPGANPTLVQSGNVDPGPGVHAWMPAIAVDGNNNMAIGFSLGGPNQYFSAGFTGRLASDAPGTTISPVNEYISGQANYVSTDSIGRNRWGDYSGLSVDPTDDSTFWVFNEYVSAPNTWDTQVGSFELDPLPESDYYVVSAEAGDQLVFSTSTPLDGPNGIVNLLDPMVELYGPDGSLLATDNNSAADGRNAILSFTTTLAGDYRVRVLSEASTSGTYLLSIGGAGGPAPGPQVLDTDPDDASVVTTFPTAYRVQFDQQIDATSVQAADLLINGIPATAVQLIDGHTFEFTLPPAANSGDGTYTLTLADGSVHDLQGQPLAAWQADFTLDQTGPVITSTTWNGEEFPADARLAPAPLVFTATLSEELYLLASARRGPFTPGTDDIRLFNSSTGELIAVDSVDFDSQTGVFTANYLTPLPEGHYRLTILSGNGSFEDVYGNDLDGEPLGDNTDGTITGDGTPGGDYFVEFVVDRLVDAVGSFERLNPLGGLVSARTGIQGTIADSSDEDVYSFFAQAGETLSAVVRNPSGANLTVELVGSITLFSTTAATTSIVIPPQPVSSDGDYELRISSDGAAAFELDLYRNSSVEQQVGDTADGNELQINDSFVATGSGRFAVAGEMEISDPAGWSLQNDPAAFVDISTTGTALNLLDDGVISIVTTIGNSVFPAGDITISNNGAIMSGVDQFLNYTNSSLPIAGLSAALLPFWDDIDSDTGNVYWEERQIDGIDALIVQWHQRPHYPNSGSATFQLQLFASGPTLVRYAYSDVDFGNASYNGGASATIGLQTDSATAIQYSFNTATLNNGDVLDLTTAVSTDEYTLDLSAQIGNTIDVVLAGQDGRDFSADTLELLNPNGVVVATATSTLHGLEISNADLVITDYVVTDVGNNVYTLRLSSNTPGRYVIAVTDSQTFATEPNSNLATEIVRDLSDTRSALGYLIAPLEGQPHSITTNGEMEGDYFRLDLSAGEQVVISTQTPFGNPAAGPRNTLDPRLVLLATDGTTVLATDFNSGVGANARMEFTAASSGSYFVYVAASQGAGEYVLQVEEQQVAEIAGRHLFYNNSGFDGSGGTGNPAINAADDGAIATDKQALLPGAAASFANYSSYSRGINGVMVDVANAPGPISLNDFRFTVGNTGNPSGWSAAPAPSGFQVREGAGVGGSDRVAITWADADIRDQWLQVTVLATAQTGLAVDDVHYWGNQIGDTGNSTTSTAVTSQDYYQVAFNQTQFLPSEIDNHYDFNRDGQVSPVDATIVVQNLTQFLSLTLWTPPEAPVVQPVADRELTTGSTLTFTAEATDSDSRPQDVLWSLGQYAPQDAVIDAQTGVFQWAPTDATRPGTYEFDVIASDETGQSSRTSVTVQVSAADPTALDRYVARPDPVYDYQFHSLLEPPAASAAGETDAPAAPAGYTAHLLHLTSQGWMDETQVVDPIWRHWVTVIVPDGVSVADTAILHLGSGNYSEDPPTTIDRLALSTALDSGQVVVHVSDVLHDPQTFLADGIPRSSDDLISYTLQQFLDTGDENWPIQVPMVQSAVAAMDAVQDYAPTSGLNLREFVVMGSGEHGWTAWLTAAADNRVSGLVPLSFDLLNADEQMLHHRDHYTGVDLGIVDGYSVLLHDYAERQVLQRLGSPAGQDLLGIMDPYEYRSRLTLPKLLVHGTGDEYFVPDSGQFYLQDMQGPTYVRYVPNVGASLSSAAFDGVSAYLAAWLGGSTLPEYSWSVENDGQRIRVTTDEEPVAVRMWQATNSQSLDFRQGPGPLWTHSDLAAQPDGSYVADISAPDYGGTGFFVELTYDVDGHELIFTSEVSIVRATPVHDPELDVIPPQSVTSGSELRFTATATDADRPRQTLTFSLDPGSPDGAVIDPETGVFRWTPTVSDRMSSHEITVRVTDSGGATAWQTVPITVTVPNPTALDSYVASQQLSEDYTVHSTVSGEGYTAWHLDLRSQTWQGDSIVQTPQWQHWMTVIVPDSASPETNDTAILHIDSGSRTAAPDSIDSFALSMALNSGMVVINLPTVPNQPLTFLDEGTPRYEDEIIAYTFDRYLDTGDESWPLLLPMVQSAVAAMDATQHFGQENDWPIRDFVITGASKRGWTTWLTAAVDSRVTAIAPMVIDLLNIDEQMVHHKDNLQGVTDFMSGDYSAALHDYVDLNIIDRLSTQDGQDLLRIVDPYEYRDRLTLPKYLVNGVGDEFFVPDSGQFYMDDLQGSTYTRYVPNVGHSLNQDARDGITRFFAAIEAGSVLPTYDWTVESNGEILRVNTVETPTQVRLWQATNPDSLDFRINTFGAQWTESALTDQGSGEYVAQVSPPASGGTAFLVELTYNVDGRELVFTTEVSIVEATPSASGAAPETPTVAAATIDTASTQNFSLSPASPLVGVDLGGAGSLNTGSVPTGWTPWVATGSNTRDTTLSNLTDETGTPTGIDLRINVDTSGGVANSGFNPQASQLPTHSQPLAGLDYAYTDVSGNVELSFRNLTAGQNYEVYVFGAETDGFEQTVTITGENEVSFTQDKQANQLWINREVGDSSRDLSSYAEVITADGSGNITIVVRGVPAFPLNGLGVPGVAIREADGGGSTVPDVLIGDARVNEDAGTASFEVSLSSAALDDVTLTLTTEDGSAAAGTDYTATTTQVTILAGQTTATATFDVVILDDSTHEPDETFTVQVQSVDAGTVGSTADTGTGTIDNDDAAPDVLIGDVTVNEADGTASFEVSLSHTSSTDITLTLTTEDGTATAGDDYTATTAQLTILAGQTAATATFDVPVLDHYFHEPDETFTVRVLSVDVGSVGSTSDSGTGTILDDDGPALWITTATGGFRSLVSEVAGPHATRLVISRNYVSDEELVVNLFSSDTSELTLPDSVTIPAGSMSAMVYADAVDDSIIDGVQTVLVSGNAALHAPHTSTFYVQDNDADGVLHVHELDGQNGFHAHPANSGSLVGDVNGDGYDDILIGLTIDRQAYLLFGAADGFPDSLDLSALDSTQGFTIWSSSPSERFVVNELHGLGDVNADGLDDFVIASTRYQSDTSGDPSPAYIVFGQSSGFPANLDVTTLDGTDGFRIDSPGVNFYRSITSAGDINGDGVADLIAGVPGVAANAPDPTGRTYVVYGRAGHFDAAIDLEALDGSDGFRIDDPRSGVRYGAATASADLNGDGYTDLLVGATRDTALNHEPATVAVLFGSPHGFAPNLNPQDLDGSNGFRIQTEDGSSRFGSSISSAGDINGDGLEDVIIGAPDATLPGKGPAGESYVIFGQATGFPETFDVADLDGTNGFRVPGHRHYEYSGELVASAGDFNGDGFDDLAIQASGARVDGPWGRHTNVYIVFGHAGPWDDEVDVTTLDGTNGQTIGAVHLHLPSSRRDLEGAADVNGDGFSDLLYANSDHRGLHGGIGEAFVVFGHPSSDGPETQIGDEHDNALTATQNNAQDILIGGQGNDDLRSNGGGDILIGGQGDDTIRIVDSDFSLQRVQGGNGRDTLVLSGSELTLNLTQIPDNRLQDIEVIDLGGRGNTLVLTQLEVLNLSSHSNTLTIRGGEGDRIVMGEGWTEFVTTPLASPAGVKAAAAAVAGSNSRLLAADQARLVVQGTDVAVDAEQLTTITASIAGRHLFYNNSAFDGDSSSADATDDNAIATDKQALLPGQQSSFANYSSFTRGLNGIMVDLENALGPVTAADFRFRTGNDPDLSTWQDGPVPTSVVVREGAGVNGSDRVTITWEDGAIRDQWLQVTVLPTVNTGLLVADVHFWGNQVGDTGNSAVSAAVTSQDYYQVAFNQTQFLPAAIDNPWDFDRNGRVSPQDAAVVVRNLTQFLSLNLMTGNVPPVLNPIPPQTAVTSVELRFTASASDVDGNNNELRFSLADGAPATATIDAISGEFRWTPQPADGEGTLTVTVQVTDDRGSSTSQLVLIDISGQPPQTPAAAPTMSVGSAPEKTASTAEQQLPQESSSIPVGPSGSSLWQEHTLLSDQDDRTLDNRFVILPAVTNHSDDNEAPEGWMPLA